MNTIRLTFKQKYQLLSIAGIFLIFIVYQFAIKKTFRAGRIYYSQRTGEKNKIVSEFDWGVTEQKKKLMDKVLISSLSAGFFKNNGLMESVSDKCSQYGLRLKSVTNPITVKDSIFQLLTTKVVIGGDYKNIILFLANIECQPEFGKLSSIQFQTFVNNPKEQRELECTVYIQDLQNIN